MCQSQGTKQESSSTRTVTRPRSQSCSLFPCPAGGRGSGGFCASFSPCAGMQAMIHASTLSSLCMYSQCSTSLHERAGECFATADSSRVDHMEAGQTCESGETERPAEIARSCGERQTGPSLADDPSITSTCSSSKCMYRHLPHCAYNKHQASGMAPGPCSLALAPDLPSGALAGVEQPGALIWLVAGNDTSSCQPCWR